MRRKASRLYLFKSLNKEYDVDFNTKVCSWALKGGKISLLRGILHTLSIVIFEPTYSTRLQIEDTIMCNLYFRKDNLLVGSYMLEDSEKVIKTAILEFDLSNSKT